MCIRGLITIPASVGFLINTTKRIPDISVEKSTRKNRVERSGTSLIEIELLRI